MPKSIEGSALTGGNFEETPETPIHTPCPGTRTAADTPPETPWIVRMLSNAR